MTAEFTLAIPGLHAERSPEGGIRFRCVGPRRSIFGIVRRIPGRLVYARDIANRRQYTGWAVVDCPEDVIRKATELMIWVAIGRKGSS